MLSPAEIELELQAIKERNRRVEADKAWETSWARRLAIALGTYAVAIIWLLFTENSRPWLNAFVPAAGYMLSTLSLPFIKRWWIARRFA